MFIGFRLFRLAGRSLTARIRTRQFCTFADDQVKVVLNGDWDDGSLAKMSRDFRIVHDFVTADEEEILMKELEPKLRRMRYQFDHWDDAIQGYRETEKANWSDTSSAVIDRLRGVVAGGPTMSHIHVLDLAADGHIKPHLDSVKFCGTTIVGLSLLSGCVMRLTHIESPTINISVLLPRRSLYIMRDSARYDFKHEVLTNEHSPFTGEDTHKGRRVSIICRSEPVTGKT